MDWTHFLTLLVTGLLLSQYPVNGDSCVSCPQIDDEAYNVHLVAHSHMDLGWVKTVQQYFFGTNQKISDDNVQYIYDSVLQELDKNPSRRFIFVETGFFLMWWNHRDDGARNLFRKLLNRGQIEFISGGIVMNDEAAAHYENIIDQMSLGLTTLQTLFGRCGVVETGWQIDPFGHSKQHAYILRKMGFNQMFYGRIDDQEKAHRRQQRTMEFNWELDSSTSINISILNNLYMPPDSFCFDQQCRDEIIVDDRKSDEFNADKRSAQFIEAVQNASESYASNHLLLTMGADFEYQNALKQFSSLDKLIAYVNGNDYKINFNGKSMKVKIVYSTPTCYARHSFGNQKLTKNHADFFPYGFPDPHSYWTGYFTSRSTFKYLVRSMTNVYHSITQMLAELETPASFIEKLRLQLAICQHHDAITGTAKQFVNDNYIKHLYSAVVDAFHWLGVYQGTDSALFCHQLNTSSCLITENLNRNGTPISIYNPLGFDVTTYLRLPVNDTSVVVRDETGNPLVSAVLPISAAVQSLTERSTSSQFEIVVPLKINGTDYRSLRLEKSVNRRRQKSYERKAVGTSVLNGKNIKAYFTDGQLTHISVGGVKKPLSIGIGYYNSMCVNGSRASGAYAFRPDGERRPLKLINATEIDAPFMAELRLQYDNAAYLTIRLFPLQTTMELDWVVGPIDVDDNIGKEYVLSVDSDLQSGDIFYTDSNGRDLLMRKRNKRENFDINLEEPISGNYYPVNSRLRIENGTGSIDIINDRAQGGTSLKPGSMEVMLHRRCLCDDGFGVNEPLSEPGLDGRGLQVRGTTRVFFNLPVGRVEELEMSNPPLIFFSKINEERRKLVDLGVLARSVHILSLQGLGYNNFLIRLENISDQKEVSLKLSKIFLRKIQKITEFDLSTQRKISENQDLVKLALNEIRTFMVKLALKR